MPSEDLHIPKHSFTAFRLAYATTRVVSESAKCVFLGSVPDIWRDDRGPNLLTSITKHAKGKVKKNYRTASALIGTSIRRATFRGGADGMPSDSDDDNSDGDFNVFNANRKRFNSSILLRALQEQEHDSDYEDSDDSAHDESTPQVQPPYGDDTSTVVSTSVHSFKPVPIIQQSHPVVQPPPAHYDQFLSPTRTPSRSSSRSASPVAHAAASEHFMSSRTPSIHVSVAATDRESITSAPESIKLVVPQSPLARNSQSIQSFHSAKSRSTAGTGEAPGVKFNLDQPRKSRISVEMPLPMETADNDIVWAEKEHSRFTRKLRSLAIASKSLAHETKRVRKRIYRNILKEYKEGEILRSDRFLVLTKILRGVKKVDHFNENEFCDTRVYSQWTEYYCVLRRTSNPVDPLSIELYELHNNVHDRKPDISFTLSPKIGAFLYSDADRSFCLTVPKDNVVYVYILKAHSQITAIRSLFFITKLGQKISFEYNVSVPDLDIKLDIRVPYEEIKKGFEHRTLLAVTELDKGYFVSSSPILEYLKVKVIETIDSYNIPQFKSWVGNLDWPWFCFKQYDSLDWVLNDSQVFLMSYNVLKHHYQLELRNMDPSYYYTYDNGVRIKEPYPIEGFLFRMTSTAGYRKSLMRSFHKMSYFFSCNQILFFSKYYQGTPPTGTEEKDLDYVYEHSPFPLDSREHITWLKSEEFEEHDQAALAEFQRRSQLIVKAEAMLDMTLIMDIRPISPDEVSKTHKMLLCLYWYSSTDCIADEFITDSAFEIEMYNGSVLRLQAPNRRVRDEWIRRIFELRRYWISREEDDLQRMMAVRKKNEDTLKISEYVDSNIKQELGGNEYQYGIADPLTHNINGLAMTKAIIMSGYLYEKGKKHSNFNQYFVVLCPGFLILYSVFKRSKLTGLWIKNPLYEHYFTIPISECYIYSGITTSIDLLHDNRQVDPRNPARRALPRLYPDGWKSSEEEHTRCFTLWFGKKRQIKEAQLHGYSGKQSGEVEEDQLNMNPGLSTMIKRLGLTGKSVVFMARSRQEREIWTSHIMSEIDRFTKN